MSRILKNNKQFRDALIVKNTFNNDNSYTESHSHALSDGDEHGKGELNGNIGSATDIKTRKGLQVKNMYNSNREYGESGTV